MTLLETAQRESRAAARTVELMTILRQYNLTLPRNAMEWRTPTEPTSGYITGITTGSVRLLCTDGIVAWFAHSDDSILFGHTQHFVTDRPLKAAKPTGGTSKEQRLKAKIAKLMQQLEEL